MSDFIVSNLIGGGITLVVALVFFCFTRSRLADLAEKVERRTDELADRVEYKTDELAATVEGKTEILAQRVEHRLHEQAERTTAEPTQVADQEEDEAEG